MPRLYVITLLLCVSAPCFSHAGHDHGDPIAGLIHLLWFAPLIIVFAFVVLQISKRYNLFNKKK